MKKNLLGLGVMLFALSLSACGQGSKPAATTVAGTEAAGESKAAGETTAAAAGDEGGCFGKYRSGQGAEGKIPCYRCS